MTKPANMPEIPPHVRSFLAGSVPSIPYLEAALLLRSEPGAQWESARLSERLYIGSRDGQALLSALASSGLAVALGTSQFRYTDDPQLRQLLDAVAEAYAGNLLAVTELIHARVDRRARVFADAFKLRKD